MEISVWWLLASIGLTLILTLPPALFFAYRRGFRKRELVFREELKSINVELERLKENLRNKGAL